MNSYSQEAGQDVENTAKENSPEAVSNQNIELFKQATAEGLSMKIDSIITEIPEEDLPPPSKRHKIKMNRLFRERVGGSFLPFPEEDTLYERLRSWLIIKLKINEFLDRREDRKRKK